MPNYQIAFLWLATGMAALPFVLFDKPTQHQQRSFVLSGVKESRDNLKKGVFRARGSVLNSNNALSKGEIVIFCAFDFESNKMRFDRLDPAIYIYPGSGKKSTLGFGGGKSIRTSEYVINAPCNEHGKNRGVLIEKPEAEINGSIKIFDIRTIGLLPAANWNKGDPYEQVMKQLIIESQNAEEVTVAEKNAIIRLDRIYSVKNNTEIKVINSIWIDSKNGFCPKRYELRAMSVSNNHKMSEPMQYTEVTWKQVDSVWVPATVRIVDGILPSNVNTTELSFDWESVNKTPNPKLFTEAGLDLKDGTYSMLDYRFGDPILLKQEGQVGPATAKLIISRPPKPWTAYWPYAVVLLAVLFLLVAVYWWYRCWKQAQLLKM